MTAVDAHAGQLLLCNLAQGDFAEVAFVTDDLLHGGIARRLRDLGFVPGATCEIVARMWPGGDPLAVRIAGSTFALRRREAECISVRKTEPHAAPT
jgi:ferrous iron transport protein A